MSYAPAPLCGPSRAAIFSEMHVGTLELRSNYLIGQVETYGSSLADDLKCFLGYRTAYFGKWGLGRVSGGPWTHGFGRYVGQLTHDEAHVLFPPYYYSWDSFSQPVPENLTMVDGFKVFIKQNMGKRFNERNCALNSKATCVYMNDIIRDEVFRFLNEVGESPFYLVWAPTYPHSGEWSPKVGEIEEENPVRLISPWRIHQPASRSTRHHGSQIEMHFDRDVGMLLDFLKDHPEMDQNTLIVVTSDNGAQEDATDYSVNYYASTGGLRGKKREVFEGGLRVPTMIRFKGTFPEGIVSRVPHALYDLGPTFREAVGLQPTIHWGLRQAPAGSASMYKTWLFGDEDHAPNRTWLHMELCPPIAFHDAECDTATFDIRRWKEGIVNKLIFLGFQQLPGGLPAQHIVFNENRLLYLLHDDPFEKHDVKGSNPTLFKELVELRAKIRAPLDFSNNNPKSGRR